MSIPNLSESSLRRHANAQSFGRGKDYYESGAVVSLTRRDNTLHGEVEGNEAEPYRVRLSFDAGGLTATHCSCAYSFAGWCKHIVATLLCCLHQPEKIEVRPTLEELLDRLDRKQTRRLLQALVVEQAALLERIDYHVSLIAASGVSEQSAKRTSKRVRRSAVDPAPFRRETRQILRNAVEGWESGRDDDSITQDLQTLIDKAQDFTEAGDANSALVVLAAISQACVDYWSEVDDYGVDSDEAVGLLDHAWTEAILSAQLTTAETTDLQKRLQNWQDELVGTFALSLDALRQGWDYPPLRQVLQGKITNLGAWEGEAPDYAEELALIRLNILDRQGRHQEYLYLAEAESQTEHYLTMLARLGQTEAVMKAAKTQLSTPGEAFAVAQTLREQGALPQALQIAQAGLRLEGKDYLQYRLATWTSDLAEGLGDHPAALSARISAFKAEPSFADYQKIQELAGNTWPSLRTELLAHLDQHRAWDGAQGKVDIFLHEGLIDNAIKAVKNLGYYRSELVHRVMDAAIAEHADWVIKNARHRAEEIIDAGKANAYHHAVDWLRKMRAAYLASGRQAKWTAYRTQLVGKHGRKYKLMDLLQQRDLQ